MPRFSSATKPNASRRARRIPGTGQERAAVLSVQASVTEGVYD
jgi:hypothetical protein